ncbi:MAG: hypothetical protein ACK4IX_03370 [Candidatus Sericytochromatia bacterium]
MSNIVLNSINSVGYMNEAMASTASITPPSTTTPEPIPTSATYINRDLVTSSNVSTGTVPAIKQNLVSKLATGTGNVVKAGASGTINATREFGNVIANEVLPKPEPLSTKLIRNKFLTGIFVGGFVNGVNAVVKVAQGEYSQDQAMSKVMRDTTLGSASGLAFATGMGATASTLGRFVGGVPLSILGLTFGTLASIAANELLKDKVDEFFA